jgi:protein gp37
MGKDSKIEWTHHTFNPWWGCVKVSPACKHCYAEAWATRVGMELWGAGSPRRTFGESHWRQPLKWNTEAQQLRERRRVFCASMADVFENRRDLDPWRTQLWKVIEQTSWLDWLLLTKRPEHIDRLSPWGSRWPRNVWLGTTAENQRWADRRVPELIQRGAAIHFVSCEPLLGPIDLTRWLGPPGQPNALNWVIAGGESGPKSRPMNPGWVLDLRDQCKRARVPYHFKQWGHWGPLRNAGSAKAETIVLRDGQGREYRLAKLGKHLTGRRLEGATWDGFPQAAV